MNGAGKLFGSFQSAFDESLVDDDLGGGVCQLTSLPNFYLLSHGTPIPSAINWRPI